MANELVIEDELRTFILGDATAFGLIGKRLYPDAAPQGEPMPYVTYFRVSGPRVRSLAGPSGVSHPRIQLDCIAATRKEAKAIAKAIRLKLDGYRGLMGDLFVQSSRVADDRDFYVEPVHNDEVGARGISLDAFIWFEE